MRLKGLGNFYENGNLYTYDGYDDGSGGFVDEEGNVVYYDEERAAFRYYPTNNTQPAGTIPVSAITPAAAAAEIKARAVTNPSSGFTIPPALVPQANQILTELARTGGQWAARQINGQTVLYRGTGGSLATMDLKSLIVPGAIIAALMIARK